MSRAELALRARPVAHATHEPRSLPGFAERVAALIGQSTWREPVEGRATRSRQVPAAHMVAGALAFGRQGPDDIGPDIAFDLVTGRMGHHGRVCLVLGEALARDRAASVRRCRPYIAVIAWAGYCAAMRGTGVNIGTPPMPDGCRETDWEVLVPAAALILERLADDTIAACERKARRAA